MSLAENQNRQATGHRQPASSVYFCKKKKKKREHRMFIESYESHES